MRRALALYLLVTLILSACATPGGPRCEDVAGTWLRCGSNSADTGSCYSALSLGASGTAQAEFCDYSTGLGEWSCRNGELTIGTLGGTHDPAAGLLTFDGAPYARWEDQEACP